MGRLFVDYNIDPIGNFVILEREEVKERTEGGLFIPDSSKGSSIQAKVRAAGPGMIVNGGTFVPTTVKDGDTVIVDKIAGFEIEDGGKKYLVVRETEIIAIVRRRD